MSVRRSEWDLDDVAAEPEWREDWLEWFRGFGIDPEDVCVPGWVEADDDARQIRFLAYVFDDEGHLVFQLDPVGAAREVRVVQLEAPALPFPERAGIYLVPELADPEHPTLRELAAGTRIGYLSRQPWGSR